MAEPRILEIGASYLFAGGMPAATTLVWTAGRMPAGQILNPRALIPFSPLALPRIRAALVDPDLTCVVIHPPIWSPFDPRDLSRRIWQRRLFGDPGAVLRGFGTLVARFGCRAPLVVVDREDLPTINRHAFWMLDRADLVFKRELPQDHWHLFLKTGHASVPSARYRRLARNRARVAKLRPISLGVPEHLLALATPAAQDKTADVFFAGRIADSSSLRQRGIAQLRALAREGLRIDIPDGPVSPQEFQQRMARAWLTWSPAGYGWDCFRHYEAPLAWSVPVISRPDIERHQPLEHGRHAIIYDIEGDGLARAIRAALADKPRLSAMAAAAREHVLAHHTQAALCRYVLDGLAALKR